MKKIMFDDRFQLTKAVLEGRKKMTRRIVRQKTLDLANDYVQRVHGTGHDFMDCLLENSRYKVGDDIVIIGEDGYSEYRSDMMPHQIRITDIRIERIQSISEEDCLKEGIEEYAPCCECGGDIYIYEGAMDTYYSAQEAFAAMIKKIYGKETWDENPWVYVYSFELLK